MFSSEKKERGEERRREKKNNMCMRISIVKWCSLTRAFHLNQLLWGERNKTKTICGLSATQIFTSLQTKTGNDSNLHLSDCTSCNAAKYIFMKSLYQYFSFNTPTICAEWGGKDHVVDSVKKQTAAMSQTTKKLIFWVKHPFGSRKKKRCEQY